MSMKFQFETVPQFQKMRRGARVKKISSIAGSIAAILVATVALSSCRNEADVASENLSTDADNFKILRRIVFINGITDKYLLSIEGFCSLGNQDSAKRMSVTCRTADGYKKHFLGLSDNSTFFAEQLDPAKVSGNHYIVTFNPGAIVPIVQVR